MMLLAECAMQDVCLVNDRSEAQILFAAADLVAAARAAAIAADSAVTAAAAAAAERPSSPADDSKADGQAIGNANGGKAAVEPTPPPPAEAPAQQQQQDSVDSHLQSALEAICCVVTNGLEVCRMTPRVICKIHHQQKVKPHFIQSTYPVIVVITYYTDIVIMPTFPGRNRLQFAGGARGGRAGLQQRRTAAAAHRRRLQVTPQAPLLCLLPVSGLLTPPSRRALAYMRFFMSSVHVHCRRLASRLNHSCRPNATYLFRLGGATISIRSLQVGLFQPFHFFFGRHCLTVPAGLLVGLNVTSQRSTRLL